MRPRRAWLMVRVLCFSGLLALPVAAATIIGTIVENGTVVASARLQLACPGMANPLETVTDAQGAYRFTTNTTGTCQLHYHGLGIEASTAVVLYDDPVTYDFAVERSASGPRLVRR